MKAITKKRIKKFIDWDFQDEYGKVTGSRIYCFLLNYDTNNITDSLFDEKLSDVLDEYNEYINMTGDRKLSFDKYVRDCYESGIQRLDKKSRRSVVSMKAGYIYNYYKDNDKFLGLIEIS